MRCFSALVIAIMLTIPMAAHAGADLSLDTDLPPPTAIYEVDPGEREGHLLAPGYWMWNGKSHVWQHSRWIKTREGYMWVPDQWQQRGEKWHLAAGHWVEDESYEDAEPEAVTTPTTVKEKAFSKKPKKRVRKTNFHDPVLWPRPTRH